MSGTTTNGSRSVSWAEILIALLVAIVPPTGYFWVSYSNQSAALGSEVRLRAQAISEAITTSPDTWKFLQIRLGELLDRHDGRSGGFMSTIFDANGAIVLRNGGPLRWPILSQAALLYDAGVEVGRLEIAQPLEGLLAKTAMTAVLGMLLGWTVLLRLRILPLRSLERALRELRTSEERFRALVEQAADAILVHDVEGRIQDANRAACEFLGYRRDVLLKMTVAEINTDIDLARVKPLWEQALRGERISVAGRWYRKDRTSFPVEVRVGRFELGSSPLIIAIVRDTSERERADAEIRQLNEGLERLVAERTAQLEMALREVEGFTYSMTHDLRSPILAMNAYAQILLDECGAILPGESRDRLQRINANARQMGQMIDSLLDYIRLGPEPLGKQNVDVASLAQAVLARLAGAAGKARIQVGEMPACQADPAMLRLVLENLISNALKFSASGPAPAIEIGHAGGAYFVRDNGVGFDMAYAGKLFGVFSRQHRVGDFEGTGVGLAMVKRIVERHGGRVWAESAPGKGATFYFTVDGAA